MWGSALLQMLVVETPCAGKKDMLLQNGVQTSPQVMREHEIRYYIMGSILFFLYALGSGTVHMSKSAFYATNS